MNKNLRNNLIKGLRKHDKYGPALRDWLEERIETHSNLKRLNTWEETLQKQGAVNELDYLIKKLTDKEEEKKENPRTRYLS